LVTLILLAMLQQAKPPELTVSLDRDRVAVGEEIRLTIRARSPSDAPLEVRLGSLDGFVIIGRTEATSVTRDPDVSRLKTIDIQLRAARAGKWKLGPFQARQDDELAQVDPLTVEVTETGSAAVAAALNPRIRFLLERARPPNKPGEVGLSILLSNDLVTVGEQVDLVTAAWFPRDLRLQLRRAPTLVPPNVQGMWSYPQPTPVGIAASRRIAGVWYDLFVAHQIVFPVREGRLLVAPAQMQYSVPLALQFFSQEERYSLTSDSALVVARPVPATGRPAGYGGAVGTDLTLERVITPPTARAREPVRVEFIVRGRGNVTLWPPPAVTWSPTARAYAELVEERPETRDGRVVGSKSFRYSLVADSVGTVPLPAVVYPYFDLGTRTFRLARVEPAALHVAAGNPAATAGALPPAILIARGPPLSREVARWLGPVGWLVLLLLPPIGWIGWRAMRRRRPTPAARPRTRDLRSAERELEQLLEAVDPDAIRVTEPALIPALRAAGLDLETATRMVTLRRRLRDLRYAPNIEVDAAPALEEWEVLRDALAAGSHRRRRTKHGLVAGLSILVLSAPAAGAQTSAEAYYRQGSLQAAASAFAIRAEAQPEIAAHWYNLGAAQFRLGMAGDASAAWQRALRLEPRNGTVRRALTMTPPPDPVSASRLWIPLVAPEELALLAAVLWLAAWAGVATRPRRWRAWAWLGTLALGIGGAAWWLEARFVAPVAVVRSAAAFRVSPHERGSVVTELHAGQALVPIRTLHGWLMARDPGDRLGWVRGDAVTIVSR
jgi:tetratricopeptide (TPR) repeat protein